MGQSNASLLHDHRGFSFAEFVLDSDRAALFQSGTDVNLRPQSFDVLRILVERQGTLVTKEELQQEIWGETAVTDDSLTHCIIDIRKVLDDSDRQIIKTVPRRGFVFDIPVVRHEPRRRAFGGYSGPLVAGLAITVIAMAVIPGLRLIPRTGPEVPLEVTATRSEAGDLYEQARFLFHRRAAGDLETAQAYFVKAIELEPEYAAAWAGLAGIYRIMELDSGSASEELRAQLKNAAERAVELDPNNAEGWMRLSNYYSIIGDAPATERAFAKAQAVGPANPLVLSALAGRLAGNGDLQGAIEHQRRAVLKEPLSFINRGNLSYFLFAAGQFEEAMLESEKAHQMRPAAADDPDTLIGFALVKLGSFEKALDVIESWPDGADKFAALAMAGYALGRDEAAAQAVGKLMKESGTDSILRMAELEAYCRNLDKSFARLSEMRAALLVRADGDELLDWMNTIHLSPFLAAVRNDPRWEDWLNETRELVLAAN
jgi:DNA-binding winged helix-turn-helix (wHTH) protein/tetratricopeptide (TPR) repeat protein